MLKRTFDCAVALVGLALTAPLLALAATMIRLESGGPMFVRDRRLGRGSRPFDLYRLRTRAVDHDGNLAPRRDVLPERVTRIGHVLEKSRIARLPELLNVFKGDMSLVGPRPAAGQFAYLFEREYRDLLQIRPGIVDPAWMSSGADLTDTTPADEPAEQAVVRLRDTLKRGRQYLHDASLWFDMLLMVKALLVFGESVAFPPTSGTGTVHVGHTMRAITLRYRRALVIALHVVLIVAANYLAFWLRFDGAIPHDQLALFVAMLPWLIAFRGLTFIPFRLYEGLWKYTGIWDLRNIVGGVLSSTVLFATALAFAGRTMYPRSVFVVDTVLLIFLMGGIRLLRRLYPVGSYAKREKRVIVFGAGDAGEMIVRDMKQNPKSEYEPIGFVDDDPAKFGRRIHDVPVLGGRRDLTRILESERPHEVLVAVPRAEPSTIREIVKILEPFRVPITTLPNLREIVNCKVAVGQIRSLSIEDLLPRAPVGLDPAPIRELIAGKMVLVTGAGGSIGSELCRQIARFKPRGVVLYERYENGLYAIANDLADRTPETPAYSAIGDVTDVHRLNAVFAEYQPDIVFHAAAHKHVPLMELNPCEAVKNNVTGTRLVAEVAEQHGVDRMILISSDKAVNPTSVMGCTKRVAEMNHLRMAAAGCRTRFVTVRFGNVLGSNGSVVPRFLQQIKAGGPVTVTHPDIERYFMLIPEAVHLVLHAATAGEPGAVYVLDMGEPIKLLDMARNLIRLSGYTPDVEIPIVFTGLRPGEKLWEDLVGANEEAAPAPVGHVFRVQPTLLPDFALVETQITELERLAAKGRTSAVIAQLCTIVPTFTPESTAVHEPVSRAAVPRSRPVSSIASRQPAVVPTP